jgi:hypothetical protein
MVAVGLSLLLTVPAVPKPFLAIETAMCHRDSMMLCGPTVPKGRCHLENYIDQLSPSCKALVLRNLKKKKQGH